MKNTKRHIKAVYHMGVFVGMYEAGIGRQDYFDGVSDFRGSFGKIHQRKIPWMDNATAKLIISGKIKKTK